MPAFKMMAKTHIFQTFQKFCLKKVPNVYFWPYQNGKFFLFFSFLFFFDILLFFFAVFFVLFICCRYHSLVALVSVLILLCHFVHCFVPFYFNWYYCVCYHFFKLWEHIGFFPQFFIFLDCSVILCFLISFFSVFFLV